MFPHALQHHSKNKMITQRDKRRVDVLFFLLVLQAHVDVQLCSMGKQSQILEIC
jgi:hypothetical protein